ncbi:MAG: NifU family protein [Simkania negevensis]|nr:NifU family protein [Simkania negevensis]
MHPSLMLPHPWNKFSHLLVERILSPENVGFFLEKKEETPHLRIISGKGGSMIEGNAATLFLVIDETDGIIADAKFQAFGESALIGACDMLCHLLLRKNRIQARRISADLIDKSLRDFPDTPAFPEEYSYHLGLGLKALQDALESCSDIIVTHCADSPPVPFESTEERGERLDWGVLNKEEKIEMIKTLIKEEIQPYIELDAGGLEVLDLKHDTEVLIAYQGACVSCPSSTGATLDAIQHILQTKIHSALVVKPDLSFLTHIEQIR